MKHTIRLTENQLTKVVKDSIKRVLNEGYVNTEDKDIREVLANFAYKALEKVDPYIADNFTAMGGNGNSCGVFTLSSPYEMNLSDESREKFEKWLHKQNEYAKECFEDDNPEYEGKESTDEYQVAFNDYYDRYNFDSAVGRIEIKIELEGSMGSRGWGMYDIYRVTSITISVNSFIFDEDNYNKEICCDCLYEKTINFDDTEDDEYFTDFPKWLQEEIYLSLMEAAKVIKENW